MEGFVIMATTNINLTEIAQSQTFGEWLTAFNENMETIDGLPIPIGYGKNTSMEYLKLSNGIVLMWGRISFGTSYPCNQSAGAASGYLSKSFTIDFPLALASNTPTVLGTVMANNWCDIIFYMRTATYTNMTGYFYCPGNDSNANNSKSLNVLVIGKWK